jgi:type I restriction enzyme S subunit
MELKPGYKLTEVGVIPEDWSHTNVSGIASRARNAIVGGPFGSDLVSRDYVEDGVPVIRGQNLSGKWISGHFAFVTPAKAKSLGANLAHPGDIVFTQRGTLGQVSLVPEGPFDAYLVSQSQMKVSLDPTIADTLFFFYVFTSNKQQKLIRDGTIQTGVPHINIGILRAVPVQLPPILEQRAIAAPLKDVDDLMDALDRLITKKRDIKQAAMQQLLTGKYRLPGFSQEWVPRHIGGVFNVAAGGDFQPLRSSPVQNERYPYPIYSNAVSKKGLYGFCSYSDHQAGSVTVTARGTLGVAEYRDHNFTAIGRVLVLEPREPVDGRFFSQLINERIDFAVENTGVPQLTAPQISKCQAVVPPFPEQSAIAEVLSDIDAEIATLEARRNKTLAIKQGMMQELLTGRIRLV